MTLSSDLPAGTLVECQFNGSPHPVRYCQQITRVFVPVPDGMTYADAEAALADAGAWVEVEDFPDVPMNARYRYERSKGLSEPKRYLVHRDDLPPTDPDAELVEKMARAGYDAGNSCSEWDSRDEYVRDGFRDYARAALAVVREHEATR